MKVRKFLLVVVDMFWCTQVEVPHFRLFLICWYCAGHECSVSWVGFSVRIIVIRCRPGDGGFVGLIPLLLCMFCFFRWLFGLLFVWEMAVFCIVALFSIVKVLLVCLGLDGMLFIWVLFLSYHCQVCYSSNHTLGQVCCFGERNYLLNLLKVFITEIEEGRSYYFRIIVQQFECNYKYDTLPYCSFLRNCWLKALQQLFDLCKYCGSFLLVT